MAKAVAEKAQAGLPAGLDIEELKNDAMQNEVMDTNDIALPFLYILQKGSPQVDEDAASYIEGAKASMIFNNVSEEMFNGRDEGIIIVPCAYERKYVEWTPRDSGGGWVADYELTSDIMSKTKLNDKKKPVLENGNLIVETAYQYVLWMNPHTGDWSQGVISLSSTGLRTNRKWNNDITTSKIPGTEIQAPRYLFPYHAKTVLETKGDQSWFMFDIRKFTDENGAHNPVDSTVYAMAKQFATLVRSGLVKRSVEPSAGGNVDDGHRASADIPF